MAMLVLSYHVILIPQFGKLVLGKHSHIMECFHAPKKMRGAKSRARGDRLQTMLGLSDSVKQVNQA
jgi:hypothetical protein